jgi:hypothetical protein
MRKATGREVGLRPGGVLTLYPLKSSGGGRAVNQENLAFSEFEGLDLYILYIKGR